MNIYVLECWDGEEWVHEGAFRSNESALEYAEELGIEQDDYIVFETELRD